MAWGRKEGRGQIPPRSLGETGAEMMMPFK